MEQSILTTLEPANSILKKHAAAEVRNIEIKNTKILTGYWHQTADERHGNPPQGNQELLLVRDKVGRPQVSLG